jgi:hypothetical protein
LARLPRKVPVEDLVAHIFLAAENAPHRTSAVELLPFAAACQAHPQTPMVRPPVTLQEIEIVLG